MVDKTLEACFANHLRVWKLRESVDGWTRLVHSADGLPTLPRLGVLHLAVPIQAVEEFPPRRLLAQLERTAHSSDADVTVSTVLRVTLLAATRLLVEDSVHEPDGALLPSA